jgi:hypothetical protein
MGIEHDIFISYAHVDNEALAEGQKGWVTLLEERLRKRLRQLLGKDVKIWRDPKLQGNDVFSDELSIKLGEIRLLLSVLSPRYLNSEWCQKELHAFCKLATANGSLAIGNKSRIFKVVKTYLSRDKHPELLKGLLGYEFYEFDESTGKAKEFSPDIDPKKDQRYWDKLEELAWDIKQLLEAIRGSQSAPTPSNGHTEVPLGLPKAIIYLAETTSDLSIDRDSIKRELRQHGYRVLPDRELPLKAPALEQAVREYLQQSKLSIHLIGAHYGIIPEMERSRSSVRIQLDLAAERCGDPSFSRLIWMQMGLKSDDERQQVLIDELQRSSQAGSDLLQTKLEDLKTVIHAKFVPKPKPVTNGHGERGLPRVYLICDKQDYDDTKPLEDFLIDHGIEVLPPPIEGDEAQILRYHKESLLLCDAVMI